MFRRFLCWLGFHKNVRIEQTDEIHFLCEACDAHILHGITEFIPVAQEREHKHFYGAEYVYGDGQSHELHAFHFVADLRAWSVGHRNRRRISVEVAIREFGHPHFLRVKRQEHPHS